MQHPSQSQSLKKSYKVSLPPKPNFMNSNVYSKIEADQTVDTKKKISAIKSCNKCTTELGKNDDLSVEKIFDDFSGKNIALGTPATVKKDERFGHVKVFEDWGDRLHRMTGDPVDLVKKNMRILCRLNPTATKQQIALAQNWARRRLLGNGDASTAVNLTGRICFIFLPDSPDTVEDMFINSAETLPCRLGLPSFWDDSWGTMFPAGFKLEYVGYVLLGHRIDKIRSVTVFHPGYRSVRDLWKPGGKTEPHPKGPKHHIAMGGLDELVCDQVQATSARQEVYGFEVRY